MTSNRIWVIKRSFKHVKDCFEDVDEIRFSLNQFVEDSLTRTHGFQIGNMEADRWRGRDGFYGVWGRNGGRRRTDFTTMTSIDMKGWDLKQQIWATFLPKKMFWILILNFDSLKFFRNFHFFLKIREFDKRRKTFKFLLLKNESLTNF